MALMLNEGSSYTPPPAGLHPALCIGVVDLGQQVSMYGTKSKLLLMFELPTCLMDDGRPFIISRRFTATLHRQGDLRPFLAAWRGKDLLAEEAKNFDMGVLLGKPCRLFIQHEEREGKLYANIENVLKPEAGQPAQASNPLVRFDLDQPDLAVKGLLPEWVRKAIDQAVVIAKPQPATVATEPAGFDDDLAF